ncbi:MAG TPA: indole-3-glycerol phosphate synthase TrpC [Lentisphaeria bacterium]|nr:MAG: hypothetical protein A2X48_20480 [Lentisphaerae bacterium GWF2_49_21]HBC86748.1 indole-3-glycerol phosphate synthase TrpC [Lentisphaeria bacterium]
MPDTLPILDILRKIVETKKIEVKDTRRNKKLFTGKIGGNPPPLDFKGAISGEQLSVIAEIKKASPSAGIIAQDFKPLQIAAAFRRAGANAVSVLTDKTYFKGSIGIISLVRKTLGNIPILRKDFIIDESQIYETRACKADSFLLIAAILSGSQLAEFILLGRSLGMEPLVECHDEEELEKSIGAGAQIVGVNNRNLRTFKVDLSISGRLIGKIPACLTAVAESGIKSPEDSAYLHRLGFNAVLVGETIMRAGPENCGKIISEFKKS